MDASLPYPVFLFEPPAALPDGRYEVIVESVELTPTAAPELRWTLRVTGCLRQGERIAMCRPINAQTLPIVAEELSLCGLTLGELPEALPRLAGVALEVTLLARAGQAGVWFHRRLGAVLQGDGDGEWAPLAA